MNIKKHLITNFKKILLLGLISLTGLMLLSYKKAMEIETEVLKPSLSSSKNYERRMRIGALNPFGSVLPFWKIQYSESPTDINYITPSITINLFGRITNATSREVQERLVKKGYRNQF